MRQDQIRPNASIVVVISGHGAMSQERQDLITTAPQEINSAIYFCVKAGIRLYNEQAKAIEEEILNYGTVTTRTFAETKKLINTTALYRRHVLFPPIGIQINTPRQLGLRHRYNKNNISINGINVRQWNSLDLLGPLPPRRKIIQIYLTTAYIRPLGLNEIIYYYTQQFRQPIDFVWAACRCLQRI